MDIKRCFEILEVDPHASREDVKRAYKDLVNVWHPDRFSENTRLRKRAEEKLKDINQAYERVMKQGPGEGPEAGTGDGPPRSHAGDNRGGRRPPTGPDTGSSATETAFEAGTRMVLHTWSNLAEAARRFWVEAKGTGDRQAPAKTMGTRPRSPQRGRGRGRRGGGGGYGPGRGRGRRA